MDDKREFTSEITKFLRENLTSKDTPTILNSFCHKYDGSTPIEDLIRPNTIFFHPSGLCLRLLGHKLLSNYFENDSFKWQYLTTGELITLNRKMVAPYYINQNNKTISLYGGNDMVLCKLYGEVNGWIANMGRI